MELTKKWISPQSAPGSFTLALIAHGALYMAALLAFRGTQSAPQLAPPAPVSEQIAYETFDEPPPAAQEVQKEVVPDEKEELQDQKSELAGVQKEAKPAASAVAKVAGEGVANVPYYKIKPKYPRAALAAGIEGWILMKVDVAETGEVQNVRIVGGEQRNMFQDEARRAVEKWKYKPFLDANAKPIKKTDHEVRIDFKLQDAA